MPAQLGGAPQCFRCEDRVYFNEGRNYMSRTWHIKCFKCSEENCKKQLESGTCNLHEDRLLCNQCYRKVAAATTSTPKTPTQEYVNVEDPDCCPRCGKRVYFAEQMQCLNRKWHKQCLCCANCSKKVEPGSCSDHEAEIYCKPCYGRKFGPKGYGFAGGSGAGLSMTVDVQDGVAAENVPHTAQAYLVKGIKNTHIGEGDSGENGAGRARPKWGGGEYCARCDKQVYIAERKQGAGNAYHDVCYTCAVCNKKLSAPILAEREAEIYCKTCYGVKFGPKGYGYGAGAGALQTN